MKKTWMGAGIALIIVYLLLVIGAQADWFVTLDRAATDALQNAIPRWLDLPFSILSLLGSFEITALVFLAVVFALFRPRDALLLVALFLLIVAVEWLGKQLINQPGPGHDLRRYVFSLSLPTGTVHTPFSFPSGHAARAAFLGVIAARIIAQSRAQRTVKAILFILLAAVECVMLVSRVYLGDHWTTDVLGGIVLGALLALPVLNMATRYQRQLNVRRFALTEPRIGDRMNLD